MDPLTLTLIAISKGASTIPVIVEAMKQLRPDWFERTKINPQLTYTPTVVGNPISAGLFSQSGAIASGNVNLKEEKEKTGFAKAMDIVVPISSVVSSVAGAGASVTGASSGGNITAQHGVVIPSGGGNSSQPENDGDTPPGDTDIMKRIEEMAKQLNSLSSGVADLQSVLNSLKFNQTGLNTSATDEEYVNSVVGLIDKILGSLKENRRNDLMYNLANTAVAVALNKNIKEIKKPEPPSKTYVPSYYVPYTGRAKDTMEDALASLAYEARRSGIDLKTILPTYFEGAGKLMEEEAKERLGVISSAAGETQRAVLGAKTADLQAKSSYDVLSKEVEALNEQINKGKKVAISEGFKNILTSLSEGNKQNLMFYSILLELLLKDAQRADYKEIMKKLNIQ